jgi:hypothetical protein
MRMFRAGGSLRLQGPSGPGPHPARPHMRARGRKAGRVHIARRRATSPLGPLWVFAIAACVDSS